MFVISLFFILFIFYLVICSFIDPNGLNELFNQYGMFNDD